MDPAEDRRRRLRIPFETRAHLWFLNLESPVPACMKNISMNGIFVETEEKFDLHTPCHVEVIIEAANSRLTMETRGFVSRLDSAGMGIQFENDMEWLALFSIFEHYGRRPLNRV